MTEILLALAAEALASALLALAVAAVRGLLASRGPRPAGAGVAVAVS